MDFVKQQISSAVQNASSSNTTNNSDPINTKNDKDKNNDTVDPKSDTAAVTQGGPQQAQDLAKTISQNLANLRALGDNGSGGGKITNTGGLLPTDLSDKQLSQLAAAAAAERAKNPDKSADTLKQMRDLESQGGGMAAALQGGVHQMAEKEAVEGAVKQGRTFLAQQQQEGDGDRDSIATTTATFPAATTAPATTNKPPVTRSKAAATLDEQQLARGFAGGNSTTNFS